MPAAPTRAAAKPSTPAGRMSDAAVKRATSHDWDTWFGRLDRAGAAELDHKSIAAHVGEKYGAAPWWSQTIAGTYERARGLRVRHQGCDGSFSANASKTIAAPLAKLYAAWTNARQRAKWLPDGSMKISTATENKSLRATWDEGPSRLSVVFLTRGADKSNVALGHENLPDLRSVAKMKAYWIPALQRLKALMER